ncbi:MAG: glycosyltransferase family 39 protein [Sedimentisphaerales bacterium]
MENPEPNNIDVGSIGYPEQAKGRVGVVKSVFFLGGPYLIFAAMCATIDPQQVVACWLFGLVFVAGGLIAWRFLGQHSLLLYLMASLVGLSLFRIWYIVAVPNELSGDEALYWQCSRNLDWCYVTKGPGAPFCIWCMRMALGNTELGVRASAIILSFGSSLVLYLLGKRLYNSKAGVFSAALLQVTPIFAFYGIGMTIDPPFIFMWLLSLLLMHWAWKTASPLAWGLLGLAAGVGILCKYTMAIFFLPALLLLIFSPARRQLLSPWPYLAMVLCLAVISPLILWNLHHGWINFFHNIGQTNMSMGLRASLADFLAFVGSQLGIITPLLLVMMVWALFKFRQQDPLSFWFSIPLLFLFLVKSLQGKVQANWALCCYLTGLISFSVYFLAGFPKLNIRLRRLTVAAVALAVCATIFLHVACLIRFPGNMDPFKKVRRGSVQLGHEVARLAQNLKPQRFILSDGYMTASLLAFYVDGQPTTYCVNLGRRVNEFDVWPTFHDLLGYDAVFVLRGDKSMPNQLQDRFQEYQKHLVRTRSTVGEIENIYSVFLCHDFKGMERVVPTRYN